MIEAMAVFKETFNAPDRTMNLASDGVWPECPAIPSNAQQCPNRVVVLSSAMVFGAALRWLQL